MQKIEVKKFYIQFLLRFSLLFIILFGLYFLSLSLVSEFGPSRGWLTFIFIYLVTLGIHFLVLFAGKDDPMKFPMYLIISTVLKLFIYGFFCFWIIYSDRDSASQNIVLFFILYLLSTSFEVISTLNYISVQNKEDKIQ